MTEWEKVRTDDRCRKAFSILAERTRSSLSNIQNKLKNINETLGHDADADAGEPKAKLSEAEDGEAE
jgi:hypothetical protein